ncbi:hypothetical protein JCM11491_004981 [Sporobolomyces phaffii]
MPNPPPPAPPPPLPTPAPIQPSSHVAPPLTKFPLHTPANASSPLITCSSSTGPLPNQTLLNLRTVLVASRFSASSRVQLKEDNKRLLNERQAIERRTAEEAGKIKEGERRRKREEEEKREKDRVEKLERERLEQKQREERDAAVKKQQQLAQAQAQAQAAKREQDEVEKKKVAWEKEQALVKQQQQLEAQQQRANKTAPKSAAQNGDTVMQESTVQPPLHVASSPEPEEEDSLQPKPPRHHDKKKKRKRDTIIDSDESDTDSTPAPEQPLLQKIRKLESSASHQPSPSSGSTPATPAPITPSARNSPLPVPPVSSNGALPGPSTPRLNPIERRLKQDRFTKHSIPIKPTAPGSATAFYVPTYSLVPVKPPVVPPVPTAKRQADVEGDFSNAKPGQQIAHSTFTNWTESYLRPFGEDDLAFLAAKPEDMSAYIIPPLGKPYQLRWEEEDFDRPPQSAQARQRAAQQERLDASTSKNYANPALLPPPLPRLRPCHLSEEAMATENIFLGPLSERVMSALALEEGAKFGLVGSGTSPTGADDEENGNVRGGDDEEDDDVDAEGEDENDEGPTPQRRNSNRGGAQGKVEMDAVDLEERIKRELRFIGLLPDEEVDWTSREDDEISTALRACQRLLQHQVELNESRKAILMSIVKDRMAYQEYETARDAQERVIEAGWHKRQRTDSKKKKKGTQKDKDRASNKVAPGGGGEEDPSKVPVSPVLMEAVEKRNALVESFKPFFDEDGGKSRWWGIPETSVYDGMMEGIEEDERLEVG